MTRVTQRLGASGAKTVNRWGGAMGGNCSRVGGIVGRNCWVGRLVGALAVLGWSGWRPWAIRLAALGDQAGAGAGWSASYVCRRERYFITFASRSPCECLPSQFATRVLRYNVSPSLLPALALRPAGRAADLGPPARAPPAPSHRPCQSSPHPHASTSHPEQSSTL